MPAVSGDSNGKGRAVTKLDIYVADDCWACEETRRIAAEIEPLYPNVDIELRDLADECKPESVFATPTYVLDGRTIFLGNPTRKELEQKLFAALQAAANQEN
jgi:glutaredoxin